ALLPNKTQGTYEELFKIVDQYIQHKPKYVTIDFEKAAENALATVFPQCDIFGCFFHFKQCELRLRNEFLENADSRHTMKNLVALAFVLQVDLDLPRTNNAVEGWHTAFHNVVGDHPSIYKFIKDIIREEQ
ncbi:unnamed protein product, partial [Didymodactylos carnosus]